MSELDDLYARIKDLWQREPERVEQERPLLARAFAEAEPSGDLALSLRVQNKRVEELQNQVRQQTLDAEARQAGYEERARILKRELDAEQAVSVTLARELEDCRRQLEKVRREAPRDEQEALAGLGWRKEV